MNDNSDKRDDGFTYQDYWAVVARFAQAIASQATAEDAGAHWRGYVDNIVDPYIEHITASRRTWPNARLIPTYSDDADAWANDSGLPPNYWNDIETIARYAMRADVANKVLDMYCDANADIITMNDVRQDGETNA